MRTYYAHPVDVLRKFNPTLDMRTLEDERYLGSHDVEKVVARIEEAESEFETTTMNPQRAVRRGKPGSPETWEQQPADLWRHQDGVKVWLDNTEVHQLDPDEGDELHIRTGRSSWRDITDETDRWELHNRDGWVRIFSRYRRHMWRNSARDRVLRITYRHGALGGRHDSPGETTLSAPASEDDGTLELDDPSALPGRGPCLVGGEEYVRIEGAGDPLPVDRGVRGTRAAAHDAGTTVHYCPADVRSAVAGYAAAELVRYDDHPDELPTPEGGSSHRDKIEDWQQEFNDALTKYSGVRSV